MTEHHIVFIHLKMAAMVKFFSFFMMVNFMCFYLIKNVFFKKKKICHLVIIITYYFL